jgi:putative FmdB family regulatory protein
MPQYDYRCLDCRQVFTIERSMSDSGEPNCESCGSANASRIWNMVLRTGGIAQDVGQGASSSTSGASKSKGGCGSCSSHSCGTC